MDLELKFQTPILSGRTEKREAEEPPIKRLKRDHRGDGSDNSILEQPAPVIHTSPKKRIWVPVENAGSSKSKKDKFVYGNYSRYYGYRNKDSSDFHDVRLDAFKEHMDLFEGKNVLDVGCNSGMLTMQICKTLGVKHITGIDIDKGLVNKTMNYIRKIRKDYMESDRSVFPFNVNFEHGNYILRDDVLLEIEQPQFELILCLSVTKWFHLNFADRGLKQSFKRMFLQLRPGGKLVLEAQPWDNYKRRKKLTEEIFENYKSIRFFPKDFEEYLLSSDVGFKECINMNTPQHAKEGFRRPIKIFIK